MSASLPSTQLTPYIEQLAGEDKGLSYQLKEDQLSIGRASSNDIIVPSESISRCHAHLVRADEGWFIKDNESKNGILVNGIQVRESWLQDGDVVQVGDFIFRFYNPAANQSDELAAAGGGIANFENPVGLAPKTKKGSSANRRYVIYAVVALIFGGIYMMDTEPTTTEGDQATQKLASDFELSEKPDDGIIEKEKKLVGLEDPILKRAEREMANLDWNNEGLKEAEQFFKKGRRDYLAKNYHRAISYFQTAITLYKGHILAERYLKRAVFEAELEAKKQMGLGIQYFESLQYQRSIYHFEQVEILMAHRPKETIINEADKYVRAARKHLKGAELFP